MNPFGSSVDGGGDNVRRPFQSRIQASRTGKSPSAGGARTGWGQQQQQQQQQHAMQHANQAPGPSSAVGDHRHAQPNQLIAMSGSPINRRAPMTSYPGSGQQAAGGMPHSDMIQRPSAAAAPEPRPFAAKSSVRQSPQYAAIGQRVYDDSPDRRQVQPQAHVDTRQYARDNLPPPAVVTQPSLGGGGGGGARPIPTAGSSFAASVPLHASGRPPVQQSYQPTTHQSAAIPGVNASPRFASQSSSQLQYQHQQQAQQQQTRPYSHSAQSMDAGRAAPVMHQPAAVASHSLPQQPPQHTTQRTYLPPSASAAYPPSAAPVNAPASAPGRPGFTQPRMAEHDKVRQFEIEMQQVNWTSLYGKRPSFNMYEQFIERKQSMDWAVLCGRTPQFQDFVAFQHELESRDWISQCKLIPTFTDYVEYLHKMQTLGADDRCDDITPTFRDYIDYFVNGDNGRKWSDDGDPNVNFANFLRFSRVRENENWREISPNLGLPLFKDYLRYVACTRAIDFTAMQCDVPTFVVYMQFLEQSSLSDYERLTGILPTFHKYLEFQLHAKSRDWQQFCGSLPTFKDYMYYLGHSTSRNWKRLEEHNDKPYFTDYMKFQQICETKRLGTGVGQFSPTFEHFIEYLIYRASKDWKGVIGRTPTFIDFVEYIECTKTREWIALGDRMPTFEEFMIERSFREKTGQSATPVSRASQFAAAAPKPSPFEPEVRRSMTSYDQPPPPAGLASKSSLHATYAEELKRRKEEYLAARDRSRSPVEKQPSRDDVIDSKVDALNRLKQVYSSPESEEREVRSVKRLKRDFRDRSSERRGAGSSSDARYRNPSPPGGGRRERSPIIGRGRNVRRTPSLSPRPSSSRRGRRSRSASPGRRRRHYRSRSRSRSGHRTYRSRYSKSRSTSSERSSSKRHNRLKERRSRTRSSSRDRRKHAVKKRSPSEPRLVSREVLLTAIATTKSNYDVLNAVNKRMVFVCPLRESSVCDVTLSGLQALRRHCHVVHSVSISSYWCHLCVFKTTIVEIMVDHLKFKHFMPTTPEVVMDVLPKTRVDEIKNERVKQYLFEKLSHYLKKSQRKQRDGSRRRSGSRSSDGSIGMSDSDTDTGDKLTSMTQDDIVKMLKAGGAKYSRHYDVLQKDSETSRYECPLCRAPMVRGLLAFREHVKTSHGGVVKLSDFRCFKCHFETEEADMMSQHLKFKHRLKVTDDVVFEVLAQTRLEQHKDARFRDCERKMAEDAVVLTISSDDEDKFACSKCTATFSNDKRLKSHMQMRHEIGTKAIVTGKMPGKKLTKAGNPVAKLFAAEAKIKSRMQQTQQMMPRVLQQKTSTASAASSSATSGMTSQSTSGPTPITVTSGTRQQMTAAQQFSNLISLTQQPVPVAPPVRIVTPVSSVGMIMPPRPIGVPPPVTSMAVPPPTMPPPSSMTLPPPRPVMPAPAFIATSRSVINQLDMHHPRPAMMSVAPQMVVPVVPIVQPTMTADFADVPLKVSSPGNQAFERKFKVSGAAAASVKKPLSGAGFVAAAIAKSPKHNPTSVKSKSSSAGDALKVPCHLCMPAERWFTGIENLTKHVLEEHGQAKGGKKTQKPGSASGSTSAASSSAASSGSVFAGLKKQAASNITLTATKTHLVTDAKKKSTDSRKTRDDVISAVKASKITGYDLLVRTMKHYVCRLCSGDTKFKAYGLTELSKHVAAAHKTAHALYRCYQCGQDYMAPEAMVHHLSIKHNIGVTEDIVREVLAVTRLKVITGQDPVTTKKESEQKPKNFATKEALIKKLRTCANADHYDVISEQQLLCDFCDPYFPEVVDGFAAFKQHVTAEHPEQSMAAFTSFLCYECGKWFAQVTALASHLRAEHGVTVPDDVIQECLAVTDLDQIRAAAALSSAGTMATETGADSDAAGAGTDTAGDGTDSAGADAAVDKKPPRVSCIEHIFRNNPARDELKANQKKALRVTDSSQSINQENIFSHIAQSKVKEYTLLRYGREFKAVCEVCNKNLRSGTVGQSCLRLSEHLLMHGQRCVAYRCFYCALDCIDAAGLMRHFMGDHQAKISVKTVRHFLAVADFEMAFENVKRNAEHVRNKLMTSIRATGFENYDVIRAERDMNQYLCPDHPDVTMSFIALRDHCYKLHTGKKRTAPTTWRLLGYSRCHICGETHRDGIKKHVRQTHRVKITTSLARLLHCCAEEVLYDSTMKPPPRLRDAGKAKPTEVKAPADGEGAVEQAGVKDAAEGEVEVMQAEVKDTAESEAEVMQAEVKDTAEGEAEVMQAEVKDTAEGEQTNMQTNDKHDVVGVKISTKKSETMEKPTDMETETEGNNTETETGTGAVSAAVAMDTTETTNGAAAGEAETEADAAVHETTKAAIIETVKDTASETAAETVEETAAENVAETVGETAAETAVKTGTEMLATEADSKITVSNGTDEETRDTETETETTVAQVEQATDVQEAGKDTVIKAEKETDVTKTDKEAVVTETDKTLAVTEEEKGAPVIETDKAPAVTEEEKGTTVTETDKTLAVTEEEKGTTVTETDKAPAVTEEEKGTPVTETDKAPVVTGEEKATPVTETDKAPAVAEKKGALVTETDKAPTVTEKENGAPVRRDDVTDIEALVAMDTASDGLALVGESSDEDDDDYDDEGTQSRAVDNDVMIVDETPPSASDFADDDALLTVLKKSTGSSKSSVRFDCLSAADRRLTCKLCFDDGDKAAEKMTVSEYQQHMATAHPDVKCVQYHCFKCRVAYALPDALVLHLKCMHDVILSADHAQRLLVVTTEVKATGNRGKFDVLVAQMKKNTRVTYDHLVAAKIRAELYRCSQCKSHRSMNRHEFRRHLTSAHKCDKLVLYYCCWCNAKSRDAYTLKKHMAAEHNRVYTTQQVEASLQVSQLHRFALGKATAKDAGGGGDAKEKGKSSTVAAAAGKKTADSTSDVTSAAAGKAKKTDKKPAVVESKKEQPKQPQQQQRSDTMLDAIRRATAVQYDKVRIEKNEIFRCDNPKHYAKPYKLVAFRDHVVSLHDSKATRYHCCWCSETSSDADVMWHHLKFAHRKDVRKSSVESYLAVTPLENYADEIITPKIGSKDAAPATGNADKASKASDVTSQPPSSPEADDSDVKDLLTELITKSGYKQYDWIRFTKTKPVACPGCETETETGKTPAGVTFSSAAEMRQHLSTKHGIAMTVKYLCPQCGFETAKCLEMVDHITDHDEIGIDEQLCKDYLTVTDVVDQTSSRPAAGGADAGAAAAATTSASGVTLDGGELEKLIMDSGIEEYDHVKELKQVRLVCPKCSDASSSSSSSPKHSITELKSHLGSAHDVSVGSVASYLCYMCLTDTNTADEMSEHLLDDYGITLSAELCERYLIVTDLDKLTTMDDDVTAGDSTETSDATAAKKRKLSTKDPMAEAAAVDEPAEKILKSDDADVIATADGDDEEKVLDDDREQSADDADDGVAAEKQEQQLTPAEALESLISTSFDSQDQEEANDGTGAAVESEEVGDADETMTSQDEGDVDANDGEMDGDEADNVKADDVEADDVEADDVEADDVESDDVEAGDVEADDVEADDVEADDVEADDVQADEVEGNMTGDTEDLDDDCTDGKDVEMDDTADMDNVSADGDDNDTEDDAIDLDAADMQSTVAAGDDDAGKEEVDDLEADDTKDVIMEAEEIGGTKVQDTTVAPDAQEDAGTGDGDTATEDGDLRTGDGDAAAGYGDAADVAEDGIGRSETETETAPVEVKTSAIAVDASESVVDVTSERGSVVDVTSERGSVVDVTSERGSVVDVTSERGSVVDMTSERESVANVTSERESVIDATSERESVANATLESSQLTADDADDTLDDGDSETVGTSSPAAAGGGQLQTLKHNDLMREAKTGAVTEYDVHETNAVAQACSYCDKTLTSRKLLIAHCKKVHKKKEDVSFRCHLCACVERKDAQLRKHYKDEHQLIVPVRAVKLGLTITKI